MPHIVDLAHKALLLTLFAANACGTLAAAGAPAGPSWDPERPWNYHSDALLQDGWLRRGIIRFLKVEPGSADYEAVKRHYQATAMQGFEIDELYVVQKDLEKNPLNTLYHYEF